MQNWKIEWELQNLSYKCSSLCLIAIIWSRRQDISCIGRYNLHFPVLITWPPPKVQLCVLKLSINSPADCWFWYLISRRNLKRSKSPSLRNVIQVIKQSTFAPQRARSLGSVLTRDLWTIYTAIRKGGEKQGDIYFGLLSMGRWLIYTAFWPCCDVCFML